MSDFDETWLKQFCARTGQPNPLEPAAPTPKRRKYGNQPTVCDGEKFDSKREARRWNELQMLLAAGDISDLRRQVRYELVPKSEHSRGVAYVADFVYRTRYGVEVVEDAKGVRTQVYVIKKKLMYYVHGINITEV